MTMHISEQHNPKISNYKRSISVNIIMNLIDHEEPMTIPQLVNACGGCDADIIDRILELKMAKIISEEGAVSAGIRTVRLTEKGQEIAQKIMGIEELI